MWRNPHFSATKNKCQKAQEFLGCLILFNEISEQLLTIAAIRLTQNKNHLIYGRPQ